MAFAWVRPQQELNPEVEVFSPVSDDAEDDTDRVLDDRYELREAIAWGGTAAVYKAFDRHLKNFVAVKVLCSGLREQIGAYFDQEGRVASSIAHPHLVRAHDRGLDDPPYIVFELVSGQPLTQLYFGRPMPWRDLCEVMLAVLDALDALHQEGIVHRDVKPDNVIVQRRSGRESRVWLLDVGYAAVPPGRISNAPEPDEIVFGTAGYIAPESFAGHPPDPRGDLYSVGATMYTMLTTRRVLDAQELGDLLAIPPPRVLAPGVEIPEAVEDLVMQALSDLEARFQSAREMAAAIRAALAPPAVEQAASPRVEPVVKARPRWWSGALLAVGAGLGAASATAALSLRSGDVHMPSVSEGAGPPVGSEIQPRAVSIDVGPPIAAQRDAGLASAVQTAAGEQDAVVGVAAPPAASPTAPPRLAKTPASTGPPRRSPARSAIAPGTAGTFAEAMAAVESKVRACADEHGGPTTPTMVKVRSKGGAVESVRVLGQSSQHPFARCVDGVVRSAKPPIEGASVEAFEFFRKV